MAVAQQTIAADEFQGSSLYPNMTRVLPSFYMADQNPLSERDMVALEIMDTIHDFKPHRDIDVDSDAKDHFIHEQVGEALNLDQIRLQDRGGNPLHVIDAIANCRQGSWTSTHVAWAFVRGCGIPCDKTSKTQTPTCQRALDVGRTSGPNASSTIERSFEKFIESSSEEDYKRLQGNFYDIVIASKDDLDAYTNNPQDYFNSKLDKKVKLHMICDKDVAAKVLFNVDDNHDVKLTAKLDTESIANRTQLSRLLAHYLTGDADATLYFTHDATGGRKFPDLFALNSPNMHTMITPQNLYDSAGNASIHFESEMKRFYFPKTHRFTPQPSTNVTGNAFVSRRNVYTKKDYDCIFVDKNYEKSLTDPYTGYHYAVRQRPSGSITEGQWVIQPTQKEKDGPPISYLENLIHAFMTNKDQSNQVISKALRDAPKDSSSISLIPDASQQDLLNRFIERMKAKQNGFFLDAKRCGDQDQVDAAVVASQPNSSLGGQVVLVTGDVLCAFYARLNNIHTILSTIDDGEHHMAVYKSTKGLDPQALLEMKKQSERQLVREYIKNLNAMGLASTKEALEIILQRLIKQDTLNPFDYLRTMRVERAKWSHRIKQFDVIQYYCDLYQDILYVVNQVESNPELFTELSEDQKEAVDLRKSQLEQNHVYDAIPELSTNLPPNKLSITRWIAFKKTFDSVKADGNKLNTFILKQAGNVKKSYSQTVSEASSKNMMEIVPSTRLTRIDPIKQKKLIMRDGIISAYGKVKDIVIPIRNYLGSFKNVNVSKWYSSQTELHAKMEEILEYFPIPPFDDVTDDNELNTLITQINAEIRMKKAKVDELLSILRRVSISSSSSSAASASPSVVLGEILPSSSLRSMEGYLRQQIMSVPDQGLLVAIKQYISSLPESPQQQGGEGSSKRPRYTRDDEKSNMIDAEFGLSEEEHLLQNEMISKAQQYAINGVGSQFVHAILGRANLHPTISTWFETIRSSNTISPIPITQTEMTCLLNDVRSTIQFTTYANEYIRHSLDEFYELGGLLTHMTEDTYNEEEKKTSDLPFERDEKNGELIITYENIIPFFAELLTNGPANRDVYEIASLIVFPCLYLISIRSMKGKADLQGLEVRVVDQMLSLYSNEDWWFTAEDDVVETMQKVKILCEWLKRQLPCRSIPVAIKQSVINKKMINDEKMGDEKDDMNQERGPLQAFTNTIGSFFETDKTLLKKRGSQTLSQMVTASDRVEQERAPQKQGRIPRMVLRAERSEKSVPMVMGGRRTYRKKKISRKGASKKKSIHQKKKEKKKKSIEKFKTACKRSIRILRKTRSRK